MRLSEVLSLMLFGARPMRAEQRDGDSIECGRM